ncbi:TetR family transcriptional regulator [Pendulispora rubella]|uniref:TetR family transcriptional regulator n=1 Tax=Pendulispora rubella TaxID=2741070 RepID=A0ABZ2L5Y8_9BACT
MSTSVDKKARRVPAAETRERILAAARTRFCQAGFDQLGVRELAAVAKVDPAIVIRLFGSKEDLFAAVADGAFSLEAPFDGPLEGLGLRIAQFLLGKVDEASPDDFDGFRFLLRSAASPIAGPILSRALHAGFIGPLAKHLGGRDAPARAALLTACVLGFVTLRVALASSELEQAPQGRLAARFGAALQACLEVR